MIVEEQDLLVNLCCIEAGIVPVCGVDDQHIRTTLENMSKKEKRAATRKFRKLLKKAVKLMARSKSEITGECYTLIFKKLAIQAGLQAGFRGPAAKKLSFNQRNFRRWIIARYIVQMSQSDT